MKIKVAFLSLDLETGREDHGYSVFNSRTEFNSAVKASVDSMIEVPSLRITFRILDVEA